MLPKRVVLVRHGESEGNVLISKSKGGDASLYTPEALEIHPSQWRLTKDGVNQAVMAGLWISTNIGCEFDRCYVSDYARALETAYRMGIPYAEWYVDILLRERDWGYAGNIPRNEMEDKFKDWCEERRLSSFYASPPSGESLAQVYERLLHRVDTLHRELSSGNVLIVTHGETIWAFMMIFERMPVPLFEELDHSKDPKDRIHNCQVIEYSRINPDDEEDDRPYFTWKRSVCPWDPKLSTNEWTKIVRKTYSNKELSERIEQLPHILK